MMQSFLQWVLLTKQIIQNGRLKKATYDYQHARTNALRNLNQFYPQPLKGPGSDPETSSRIPYGKALIGQAAFFKQAWQRKAGHLFVPILNIACIRNPKAASTSLSLALLEKLYPELGGENLSGEQINFLTDLNLHHQITPAEKQAVFFMVVRNPFHRLVSVYRNFFERPAANFIYDDYLFGILKKEIPFAEFVNRILIIPDRLKDQHLKPQTDFLKFYQRRNIDVKILKLEAPDSLRDFLKKHSLTLPMINKDPIPTDYRQYYDSSTIEKVGGVYANDIKMLGYTQEYRALRAGK